MDWPRWINLGASAAMAASALLFAAVYHCLAPWRASVVGRHMMAVAVVLTALGSYTVLISVWPESSTLRLVRATIVAAMAALMTHQTVMVVRAQRGHRTGGTLSTPTDEPAPDTGTERPADPPPPGGPPESDSGPDGPGGSDDPPPPPVGPWT